MAVATGTAILGAAALGIGASLMSSKAQGDAADSAAAASKYATDMGVQAEMERYYDAVKNFKPFYEAGVNALTGYQAAPSGATAPTLPTFSHTFDPNDPNYLLAKSTGEEDVNRALAARGLWNSRPGVNALSDYNAKLLAAERDRQYANKLTEYGIDYSKATDTFNIENTLAKQNLAKYADIVNVGTGAASNVSSAGMSAGNVVSSLYGNYGNVAAQSELASGQAKAGLYQDIGTLPTNLLASYYFGQKSGLFN